MTRITELTPLLKRLQLGPMAATLPERIALARRDQLDYASFLEIIFSDEVSRRAQRRIELRLNGAGFEETCRLEDFDWSASITLDRSMCEWRARGRPQKSTATVDFTNDTGRLYAIDEMADLAGVGTTLISQAKLVWSLGLAENVAEGKVGFAEAYRRARVVRGSEWEGAVLNGGIPFDDAYERALANAPDVLVARPRRSRSVKSLIEEVRELEQSKAALAEELRLLREDNAVQPSAVAATAMALEREQIRAEKAEAEVDRLREELTRTVLHP